MSEELEPRILRLHPEAEDLLEAFGRETQARAHESAGPMAAVHAKARGQALRLATVLEHLWWSAGETGAEEPQQVSRAAMAGAIELVGEYFTPMAERVFGDAAIPHDERLAMTLARYLRQKRLTAFNQRGLSRRIGAPLRLTENMKIACRLLEQAHLIRERPRPPGAAGRPSLDYEINPAVYEMSDRLRHVPRDESAKSDKTEPDGEATAGFGTNGTIGTRDVEGGA
jgi:hypothetical protein